MQTETLLPKDTRFIEGKGEGKGGETFCSYIHRLAKAVVVAS
jgi:hypothetical protein